MKASEVSKLSLEEIKVEETRLRARHFELRSQSVTQKIENTSELGNIRRDVARLLTERKKRQLKKEIA
jgi:large subunit ribosomal protein L29